MLEHPANFPRNLATTLGCRYYTRVGPALLSLPRESHNETSADHAARSWHPRCFDRFGLGWPGYRVFPPSKQQLHDRSDAMGISRGGHGRPGAVSNICFTADFVAAPYNRCCGGRVGERPGSRAEPRPVGARCRCRPPRGRRLAVRPQPPAGGGAAPDRGEQGRGGDSPPSNNGTNERKPLRSAA